MPGRLVNRILLAVYTCGFALGFSRRWNRLCVSDHKREWFLHRVAQNIIGITNRRYYLHVGDSCQTRSRQASLASSNHSAREIIRVKLLESRCKKFAHVNSALRRTSSNLKQEDRNTSEWSLKKLFVSDKTFESDLHWIVFKSIIFSLKCLIKTTFGTVIFFATNIRSNFS